MFGVRLEVQRRSKDKFVCSGEMDERRESVLRGVAKLMVFMVAKATVCRIYVR